MNTAISRQSSEAKAILLENLAEDTREEEIWPLFGQYRCVSSRSVIPGAPNRKVMTMAIWRCGVAWPKRRSVCSMKDIRWIYLAIRGGSGATQHF
jgi:hypothetical protein